nr:dehydrogenase, E1 component [Tanacetum cinerariifolium]
MLLLEESIVSKLKQASHVDSSSPTVLVAANTGYDRSRTMRNFGIKQCRNYRRGTCTYEDQCSPAHYYPVVQTPQAQQAFHVLALGSFQYAPIPPTVYPSQTIILSQAFPTMTLRDLA